jgi:hypothetical protein
MAGKWAFAKAKLRKMFCHPTGAPAPMEVTPIPRIQSDSALGSPSSEQPGVLAWVAQRSFRDEINYVEISG